MLGHLNAGMERFRSIFQQYRNTALPQNFTGIDSGIDEMDGASGFSGIGIECLLPGSQPPECG